MPYYSQNGWRASDTPSAIGIVPISMNGVSFPGGCRDGDVKWIFGWYLARFDREVESLHKGWCWGYAFRPNKNDPDELSNHASGTALDINAPAHPNGKRGTFSKSQMADIDRLCRATHGALRSGAFYKSTVDAMHLEVVVSKASLHEIVASMKKQYGPFVKGLK